MIESECMSPSRPPTRALSVPSIRIVVGCERTSPPCELSASFAFWSSRLFASETPPENANQLATAHTITSTSSTRIPSEILRPQRTFRLPVGAPGPRYSGCAGAAVAAAAPESAALDAGRAKTRRRNLPLGAAASVDAVRLLFARHPAG